MSKRVPALSALPLAVVGAVAFAFSASAVAQEAAPAPVEKIEITGSLIKRVESETALPVEVISREQIERIGATNAEQILQQLTSNSGIGGLVGAQGVGLETFGQSSASLRGLGSQRTLVLINGQRMAEFPGGAASATATSVDLNSIPTGAIERIEVLQDGASSIYGSEAVAGVINIILRRTYKGVEASAYLGTPTRPGGGRTEKAGVVFGFGDYDADRYNANFSLDGEHNQALYGRDRDFATNSFNSTLYDTSATANGSVAGPWVVGTTVNNQPALGPSTFQYGNALDPYQCFQGGPYLKFDPNVGTCRFNPNPLVPLLPTIDRLNAVGNFSFKLNDNTKLYAELIYAHTKTDTTEQPSPYNFSFFTTDTAFKNPTLNPGCCANNSTHTYTGGGVQPTLLIYPSNTYYQSILVPNAAIYGPIQTALGTAGVPAGSPLSVSARLYDGGGRDHTDAADAYRILGGVTGNAFNWDYDATVFSTKSRVEEDTVNGYQSQFALAKLLNGLQGSTAATAWNPWGPNAPNVAAAIRGTNYDGLITKQDIQSNDVDARASRPIYDLPGGPLSVGVGINARRETIDLISPGIVQLGDVSGYGAPILPFSNGRSAYAAYGELDAPLVKRVELDAAVRTDKYTGVASVTSPKGTLRIQASDQLLLRGSIGKGFRAPSLPELYTPQFTSTTATIEDPLSTSNPKLRAQFTQLTGGNPNLLSEKSTQDSYGFVLEPIKDVSMSLDYFAVRISNTIGALSPGDVLNLEAEGNPLGKKLVTRGMNNTILLISTLNQNLGDLAASGEEVNVRWRSKPFDFGRVSLNLTGTYMNRYDQVLPDGSVEGSVAKTTTNPGSFTNLTAVGNDGGVVMRWKHNLEILLQKEDWDLSFTQHFQTGYEDAPDNFGNPHNVGAFATWDMQYGFRPTKDLKLALGMKNIFDLNPPAVGQTGTFFQVGYDPTYYDARARFVYGTLSYKFK
ncbi:MAG: TonB-dependent receptor [Burkholderiaceae bacterium]|nr:TonB-dependent receptor [Burkholderiaceae bacterium]